MTLRFASARDKLQVIDLIRKVLQDLIFHGIAEGQRLALLQHIEWMGKQRENLNVNCRLETVPELRLTRVVIEASFADIAPMRAQ